MERMKKSFEMFKTFLFIDMVGDFLYFFLFYMMHCVLFTTSVYLYTVMAVLHVTLMYTMLAPKGIRHYS